MWQRPDGGLGGEKTKIPRTIRLGEVDFACLRSTNISHILALANSQGSTATYLSLGRSLKLSTLPQPPRSVLPQPLEGACEQLSQVWPSDLTAHPPGSHQTTPVSRAQSQRVPGLPRARPSG